MIPQALKLAVYEVRRNLLRSALTTLGIIIGVAAVIALVTLGEAASNEVLGDIEKLGSNLLTVSPGQDRRGPGAVRTGAQPFDTKDFEALREQLGERATVAPSATRQSQVILGSRNHPTSVTGTTNAYLAARDWELSSGREFELNELRGGRPACILGATVQRELFGSSDPIGAKLRLGGLSCRVVGTLEEKGQTTFGIDQDDLVLLPLRTFERRLSGNSDIGVFFISALGGTPTRQIQSEVEALMRERRQVSADEPDDFNVLDMKEIAGTVSVVTDVLTAFLGSIAAVSLIVGGIGIMNMMLVSVTERTREIGIRLAIGALERDVLWQFLAEAVVLSAIGGLIGVLAGVAGSLALCRWMELNFSIDLRIVALAFAFSTGVGVIFGFLPARKAARMDPIEALRYES